MDTGLYELPYDLRYWDEYRTTAMRPNIDVTDEEAEKVEDYAESNGLRRSRAWAEIVRAGLEAETDYENEMVRAQDFNEGDV